MNIEFMIKLSVVFLILGIFLGACTGILFFLMDIKTAWYAVMGEYHCKIDRKKTKNADACILNTETVCLDTIPLDNSIVLLQEITNYSSTLENFSIDSVM